MTEENYNNLSGTVEDIESANEFGEIELKNKLRLELETKARRKIIYVWLPIVGLAIISIIWFIVNTPNYNGCVKSCLKRASEVNMQTQDDCDFYCKIKYSK